MIYNATLHKACGTYISKYLVLHREGRQKDINDMTDKFIAYISAEAQKTNIENMSEFNPLIKDFVKQFDLSIKL